MDPVKVGMERELEHISEVSITAKFRDKGINMFGFVIWQNNRMSEFRKALKLTFGTFPASDSHVASLTSRCLVLA